MPQPHPVEIGLMGLCLILDLVRLRCMLIAESHTSEGSCAACLP